MAESQIPQPPSTTIQTSNEPPRTLWMGDLDPSFDETTIQQIWMTLGHQVQVKLIRAKKNLLIPCSTSSTLASSQHVEDERIQINGVSFIDPNTTQLHHAGYCFVQFPSLQEAQAGLQLNSTPLPNLISSTTHNPTNPTAKRNFRLNWASGATLQSDIPTTPEFSLFVGDLSPTATEAHLLSLFQTKFKSVKTVRVMTDPITGASRCFGFVRFADEQERRRALVEMNGIWCQGRQLRVAYATPRNNILQQQQIPVPGQLDVQPQLQEQELQQQKQPQPQQPLQPQQLQQLQQQQHQQPQTQQQPALLAGQEHPMSLQTLSQPQPVIQTSPTNQFQQQQQQQQQQEAAQTISSLQQSQQLPTTLAQTSNQQSLLMSTANSITGTNTLPMVTRPVPGYTDPSNTTVFIGGLNNQITESQLQSLFMPFGNILSVKVPPGKGCGFVKFEHRLDAEAAIQGMQGFIVGNSAIRLSWGRTHSHSHSNSSGNNNIALLSADLQQQQQHQQAAVAAVAAASVAAAAAAVVQPHSQPQQQYMTWDPPAFNQISQPSSSSGFSMNLNTTAPLVPSASSTGMFHPSTTAAQQAAVHPSLLP